MSARKMTLEFSDDCNTAIVTSFGRLGDVVRTEIPLMKKESGQFKWGEKGEKSYATKAEAIKGIKLIHSKIQQAIKSTH